jgi:hypothetical protein
VPEQNLDVGDAPTRVMRPPLSRLFQVSAATDTRALAVRRGPDWCHLGSSADANASHEALLQSLERVLLYVEDTERWRC